MHDANIMDKLLHQHMLHGLITETVPGDSLNKRIFVMNLKEQNLKPTPHLSAS